MFPELNIFSLNIVIYDLINNLVLFIAVFCNWMMFRKDEYSLGVPAESFFQSKLYTKNKSKNKIIIFLKSRFFIKNAEIFLTTFFVLFPLLFMNRIFGNLFTGGSVNYFGSLYTFPIFAVPLCLLLGRNPVKTLDKYAHTYAFSLIFIKLACFFAGCCAGVEWKYGLYNHSYDETQFPVQLVEMLWAFLIFLFLLRYQKKAKPGTAFPAYVFLYSITRFCSEFLRVEENYIWIFKKYHIFCFVGIILGVVEYILAVKYAEKISEKSEMMLEKYREVCCNFYNKTYIKRCKAKKKKSKKKDKKK